MADPQMSLMLRETAEAPEVVGRLLTENEAASRSLAARLGRKPVAFAVTCARGSSDSAATFAKYLLELRLGTAVASIGPSVSSVYGSKLRLSDALFLAISQSGRSPDLLKLTEAARDDGALAVAIVNDVASPLAELCDVVLPLHAGPERSVAATKSYLASLAALLQLVAHWSADPELERAVKELPESLEKALAADWRPAVPELVRVANIYVVGRGPGFAAAQEAAIKLKETCSLHGEAMSAAELRHGPIALAGRDFPVMLLSQADASLPSVEALGRELTERGVPVITAGAAEIAGSLKLPAPRSAHPFAQPILLVQSFYRLAEAVSRARGLDPDRPPHLNKVTRTT